MTALRDLVAELSGLWGPPGREEAVAAALAERVRPHVDEVRRDPLGNVLALRRGRPGGPRRLLLATMDGPGGIVLDATAEGRLRFAPLGGLSLVALRGQRVRFAGGTPGVVGGEPADEPGDVKPENTWVDVGASDREEALRRVAPGSFFVLDQPVVELGADRLAGPHLAGRAGCAVLVRLAEELAGADLTGDLHLAFTVQGSIAPRGARTAGFQVQPDLAVVVTWAAEGSGAGRPRLGQGPVLRLREAGWLARPAARQALEAAARAAGVGWQPDVADKGASEAPGVEAAAGGAPTGVVGYPLRYRGTPLEVVALPDLEGLVRWLRALAAEAAAAAGGGTGGPAGATA